MTSEAICSWLRDKAARADGHDYRRMLTAAADRLVELEKELREERYRHDRLQDFEVAEAKLLAEYKNTGLTPEQVAFLVSPDMQEMAQLMKECLEMIQGGEAEIFGLPAEQVMQLVQAEKEGRLFVKEEPA